MHPNDPVHVNKNKHLARNVANDLEKCFYNTRRLVDDMLFFLQTCQQYSHHSFGLSSHSLAAEPQVAGRLRASVRMFEGFSGMCSWTCPQSLGRYPLCSRVTTMTQALYIYLWTLHLHRSCTSCSWSAFFHPFSSSTRFSTTKRGAPHFCPFSFVAFRSCPVSCNPSTNNVGGTALQLPRC